MTLLRNAAAAALMGMALCAQAQEQPKYIFYFIGDGMGMGPVMAAQTYNRLVLNNPQPLTMMQFPAVSWCQTWSASSPVTDSAAAGTALSTGQKTRNGMLGQNADSVSVTSIARILHDNGYGVGVVTTVAADDATPGAFYAHVPSRKMKYDIDLEGVQSNYEYIAGAGYDGFKDSKGNDTDLAQRIADANIELGYGASALGKHDKRRVMIFADETGNPWNVGYTIDSIKGALTLPALTADCMQHLQQYSPDRFFMMVEGGNIDHALHANDGGAAIKEILQFNKALQLAYDFYKQHPDETLIVVTADHDTGGLAFGNNTVHYGANLNYFDYQRVSKEEFSNYCKGLLKSRRNYNWDDMKEYLRENLGLFGPVAVDAKREAKLKELFDQTFEQRNSADQKTLYASFNQFAVEVFNTLNDLAGVTFTTSNHTGNPVPVFAVGKGVERFTGFNNNVELPATILDLAGYGPLPSSYQSYLSNHGFAPKPLGAKAPVKTINVVKKTKKDKKAAKARK